MRYKPISGNKIETYEMNGGVEFNDEYYLCKKSKRITNKMGYFILRLANNCVARYNGKYRPELVMEMHQHIVMDITERLLTINVRHNPFATVSITMQNRCKNFIRNIGRGNFDIYGTRIGDRTKKTKFINQTDNENHQ